MNLLYHHRSSVWHLEIVSFIVESLVWVAVDVPGTRRSTIVRAIDELAFQQMKKLYEGNIIDLES